MEIVLGKMGEMVLKGLNRRFFENRMIKSLRHRLARIGNYKIYTAQSTLYIEPADADADMSAAFEKTLRIFGLVTVCRAYSCEKNIDAMVEAAKKHLGTELLRAKNIQSGDQTRG